jgi:glutathione S-transferase
MELYGFPSSTNVWMVRAIAAHLNITLEFKLVDPFAGGLATPEFLQLNPTGRVPVLVDDDFVLWESNAIAQYLASQTPNSLYPEDIKLRADIMRWQSWQMSHWKTGCQPLQYENLVKPMLGMGEPDPQAINQATTIFYREAAVLDRHLTNREYLVDNSLTLADFAVGAYLPYAKPAHFPLESYPNIQKWFAKIESLPAWQETAPPRA